MGSGPALNAGSTLKSTVTEANSIGSPGLITPRTMLAPAGQSERLTLGACVTAEADTSSPLNDCAAGWAEATAATLSKQATSWIRAASITCDMARVLGSRPE